MKIDTEKYPDLASRFNIQALPTLVLFKNGQVADRIVSLVSISTNREETWLQISLDSELTILFGGLLRRKVFSDQRS